MTVADSGGPSGTADLADSAGPTGVGGQAGPAGPVGDVADSVGPADAAGQAGYAGPVGGVGPADVAGQAGYAGSVGGAAGGVGSVGSGPMSEQELIDTVAARSGLSRPAAEQAVRQVLRSIGRVCGRRGGGELLHVLPPSLAAEVIDGADFGASGAGGAGAVGVGGADFGAGVSDVATDHIGVAGDGGTGALYDSAARPIDTASGDPLIDREVFIGPMVQSFDTEYGYDRTLGGMDLVTVYMDDDAARRVQAVFGALRSRLSSEASESLAVALPQEISDWWRSAPPE